MVLSLLTALLFSQVPNTTATTDGTHRGQDVHVTGGTVAATQSGSWTINSAGAANTTGSTVALNGNSVCATVAMAGQQGVSAHVAAGTLATTLTASYSNSATVLGNGKDCNAATGRWDSATIGGGASVTLTNPNSEAQYGIALPVGGVVCVEVCTASSGTTGSASAFLVATTAPPPVSVTVAGGATSANQTNNSQTTQVVTSGGTQLLTDDPATTSAASESATVRLGVSAAMRALDTSQGAGSQLVPIKATSNALWVLLQNASIAVTGTFWQATQPVSGTVTTSPPANASTNVTQFGGNAVATGTGAGGVGVPRMTVSNDSQVQLWDGTNVAKVQAASTGPVLADKALTVAQSPNVSEQCPSTLAVSQTTSTDLLTSSAKLHICSIVLVSATAQSVSLVEGTGTVCATGIAALVGSTTAANGPALAANGGFVVAAGVPWLKSKTTADHLCLLQSGAGNLSGVITYVDQ